MKTLTKKLTVKDSGTSVKVEDSSSQSKIYLRLVLKELAILSGWSPSDIDEVISESKNLETQELAEFIISKFSDSVEVDVGLITE